MNHVQRVLDAISRVSGAPVPRGELVIERTFMESLFQCRGNVSLPPDASETDMLMACCRLLDLDLVCVQAGATTADTDIADDDLAQIRQINENGLFPFLIVNGSFETAMQRQGFMPFITGIAHDPDLIGRDLKHISAQVTAVMEQGAAAGARGIILADDIAYNQGTFVDPEFVARYLLPLWQSQVAVARSLKIPVFFHSDGDVRALLPLLVEAGFDGLQCIEPAAGMDIPDVQANFGKDLCLMGNIDPALLSESPVSSASRSYKPLRQAVTDLMTRLGNGEGGFIFGTCSGLHGGMSPQRVLYMYELASQLDTVLD